ncbi:MAG: hypothetical protein IPI55_07815 [Flavobacteriales bacterium]|nr:hypothetical protein [Flavobacteriales bacterium]
MTDRDTNTSLNARDSGPIVFAFALAAVPLIVRLLSPGIPDAGDGILHYQYARWCWSHPALLLDLWAKPVFTLLASPFALLDAWGLVLMNVLLAATTAVGIGAIVRTNAARWLAPLLLLLAPVYFHNVMSGMTEVLFGAAAIGVVWLLLKQRFKHALILASFMPLMRPEWIAFLPCVLVYAAWHRAWRTLPWLLLGSGVYAVLAFVAFGDPLHFFTHDPYAGNSTYGTGAADHFIRHMDEVLGTPLIVLLLCCICVWPFVLWKLKGQRKAMMGIALLTLIPALGILLVHSYAWWKGGNGSLGLLRVLGTGIPLVALFVLHTLTKTTEALNAGVRDARRQHSVLWIAGVALGTFGLFSLIEHVPMPVARSVDQELLLRAGVRVQELDTLGQSIVCQDPMITYAAGRDPFDTERTRMIWAVDKSQEGLGLGAGDLLVWDAHFAPNEGGLPLERVMNDRGLRLLELMAPRENVDMLGGHPMEVYIFRRLPGQRMVSSDTLYTPAQHKSPLMSRYDTVPCPAGSPAALCFTTDEFPFTLEGLPRLGDTKLFDEIVVQGTLDAAPRDSLSLFLVFAEYEGHVQLRYHQISIKEASFSLVARVPPRSPGVSNKLYIWNRQQHPLALRAFTLTRNKWEQE